MAEPAYDFENFPRRKLPLQVSRREFFSGLIHEIGAFSQPEDHRYVRLSDLGDYPNQGLAVIVPVLQAGGRFATQEGFIYGYPSGAQEGLRLFPADSPAAFVLEQFNGNRSIVEASRNLAIHSHWEKPRAFAYVRGVFLWLVLAKLYIPQ